ncbi:hypothetical protein DV030_17215 [Lacticaseibacillus paracasei]|nr:hypothetical protein [Lacticaseibacillus paracasei]
MAGAPTANGLDRALGLFSLFLAKGDYPKIFCFFFWVVFPKKLFFWFSPAWCFLIFLGFFFGFVWVCAVLPFFFFKKDLFFFCKCVSYNIFIFGKSEGGGNEMFLWVG